ncbi:MAG TPA: tetratricopeptide repeat protein [Chthoniobacteraceae bacterium]|nr:tetratricopeptide repeat protein [Chthoniobacteraceae bacterium]
MKFARVFPPSSHRLLVIAIWLALGSCAWPQQPLPLDVQKAQQALQLFNQGKYAEAAQIYEALPRDHPTSALVPEAMFRLAYIHFLNGEDAKAIETIKRNLDPAAKNIPPEIAELSASMAPQFLAAKAAKMSANDPARKAAFEEAVKEYDAFIKRFPQSDEVEMANYGKARAHYQLQQYDLAANALRTNLQKFPQSASAQDTQFLLAVVLATQANVAMQKATAKDPTADAAYDEALRLLADIIQKRTDIALANDAQFQLGEILLARSNFAAGEQQQQQLARRALDAFRAVAPKDAVVKAQQDRLAQIQVAIQQAVNTRDMTAIRRAQRLQQREQEKLAALEQRADQSTAAKLKSGQAFITLQDYDAARVLFRFLQPFTEEPEQQKQLLYYLTLTYAAQHIADKAVENYDKFMTQYRGDPIGENLPLLVGMVFLDPRSSDPNKAIEYFKQESVLYPKSKFVAEAVMQEALALIPLAKYDEALAVLKNFLASSPSKEQGAAAQFGLATIYQRTNKIDEAIAAYKTVRDKYPGTPQAEQSAFWIAQLIFSGGDSKAALDEFRNFLAKFPKSDLAPAAMLLIGQAQAALGQKENAIETYKELAQKHPKSEAAMGAYFQRATMAQNDANYSEVKNAMREFIAAYPESDRLFSAYDYIAQVQVVEKQLPEAIATYEEFVQKHPKDENAPKALLKTAAHWKTHAENQGIVYLNLNDEQKATWRKAVENSIRTAEKVLEEFPESSEVALALQALLAAHKMQIKAKLEKEPDVEKYFSALAARFEAKRSTKSKILFALAGFLAEKDMARAVEIMTSAYDPKAVYSAADLDLYGSALIDQKKYEEAQKVFDKLAADYPVPPGTAPGKAPRSVWEPQSIALFGTARVLQEQGKAADAQKKFEELKKTYPYSPKLLEADYGIAATLARQKKNDEALRLLANVSRQTHAPAPLRAKAMLLLGKILEAQGKYEEAINSFIKIGVFFEGVPEIAAEGLWLGAQLQEQQATGKIPIPPQALATTPPPRATRAAGGKRK